ncbi:MAG: efflux RND transporter periplasmic adaptor subunit [Chthoniobacteraceae bacterium]|jgi:RND family efflux transporter MFP subunit
MSTVDERLTARGHKPTGPAERIEPAKTAAPPAEPQQRLHPPVRQIAVWGPLVAVMAVAALIIMGVWRHVAATHAQEEFAQQIAQTVVTVQTVQRDTEPTTLVLPGSIEANQVTTLYARTNGYLGKWLVDIGDNVKAGQLLATIETPDVEQQLRQAEGTLNQAHANYQIAKITAERWQRLFEQKVVDSQDNDTQQSGYRAATAAQAAAQANVDLLEQQLSFNQITAPFDGKITYRYLDIGALVSAGSGSGGTQIYDIAQTDPLRIYVYVPQNNAPSIRPGVTAKVLVRELPNRDFVATVTRTAGAIDPQSRTLLTELLIANKEGTLYAGMYGQIKFSLDAPENGPIIVPANAYIFRPAGAQVVVVRDGKVHWQTIEVGRDFGPTIEALSGLNVGDNVVMNPTDDLQEGMPVQAQEEQPSPGAKGQ